MEKPNFNYIEDALSEFMNQMEANYSYIESLASISTYLKKIEFEKDPEVDYKVIEKVISAHIFIRKIIEFIEKAPEEFYDKIIKTNSTGNFEELNNLVVAEENSSMDSLNQKILEQFVKVKNEEIRLLTTDVTLEIEDGDISFKAKNVNFQYKLKKYIDIVEKQHNYNELLLRTSLISVSNTFESLINNLIFLLKKNDKNCLKNKKVDFEKVENFETIEELRENLIEEAVQDVLRGNQISWLDYISEKTGNGKNFFKETLKEDVERFEEFFLSRNLITHNNSTINNIYIEKVTKYRELESKYKIGDKLDLTEDYLLKNLDLIYFVAVKACYMLSTRIANKDRKKIFSFLSDVAYKNLVKRPQISVLIYDMLTKESKQLPMSEKLIFSINNLQALKWSNLQERFEEFLGSVDFSTASSIHKMCLKILTDDFEKAVFYLKKVVLEKPDEFFHENIEIEQLIQELVEWPVFKNFKNSQEFKEYLKSINLDNEKIYFI